MGSLRYSFGGDHPSQTTRQAVSPSGLGPRRQKGGISTSAPRRLAPPALCLPPILHIRSPGPALSCSKGSRGLSVPLRVSGIFTATTISPSSWPRQRPDRYTIRAGRNLPDKEFRYLRTVIVTAAVYRGFDSALPSRSRPLLTFRHRAGVRPYSSSFDFAKPCVFGKQSPGPFLCALLPQGPLLPKLRGHFAEFLGHDSLEHLRILSSPTCVGLRYGLRAHVLRSFSRQPASSRYRLGRGLAVLSALGIARTINPGSPNAFNPLFRQRAGFPLLRPSFDPRGGKGMLTFCPSATPFGCALGPDLP